MSDAQPPLVLIVDDNEKNLKLTRDVLSAAGFRIIDAPTGAAGIAAALESRPDVILMDLRLPDMDGTEAARRLRRNPRTQEIPVIAFTALAVEANREWLLESGFDDCLEKPIDVARLPNQIRSYCRPKEGNSGG